MTNEVVIRICPICKQNTIITIPTDTYDKWTKGMSIQRAWPNSSDTDDDIDDDIEEDED